ncbi:MAG: hypothetical protein H6Q74_4 [Firmicutes bacterium]|nr:hypothetical protein [Bacillota bacterium]
MINPTNEAVIAVVAEGDAELQKSRLRRSEKLLLNQNGGS